MPKWTTDENGLPVYVEEDGSYTYPDDEAFTPTRDGDTLVDAPANDPAPVSQLASEGAVNPNHPQFTAAGVGYSYSGFDPNKVAKANSQYDRDLVAADRMAAAGFENSAKPLVQTAHNRQQGIATDAEVSGAPSMLAVEQQIADTKARGEARLAQFYQDAVRTETQAEQAAVMVREKAKSAYMSQVMAFQAMEVNPAQWWGNLGSGGRAGAGAVAFASAFLNARGVNGANAGMDALNTAIDRNIDAQVRNIAKQGEVANMFGKAYDMVVAESASDREVRLRLRGLSLAQAEKEIIANLSQYDAPLAQAKAVEARLMIQDQLNRDLTELDQIWGNRAQAAKNNAVDMARARISAAAQKYAVDAELEMAKLRAGAGKAVTKELLDTVAFDPTQPGSTPLGLIVGNPESQNYTRKFVEGTAEMQALAKDFQEAQKTWKGSGLPGSKAFQGEQEAWLRANHARYISAKVKVLSGLTVTDVERKFIEDQMPQDTWVKDGWKARASEINDNDRALRSMMGSRIVDFDSAERAGYLAPGQAAQLRQLGTTAGGLPESAAMATEAREVDLSPHDNDPTTTVTQDELAGSSPTTEGMSLDGRVRQAVRGVRKRVGREGPGIVQDFLPELDKWATKNFLPNGAEWETTRKEVKDLIQEYYEEGGTVEGLASVRGKWKEEEEAARQQFIEDLSAYPSSYPDADPSLRDPWPRRQEPVARPE